jgi:hypothetical protein
MSTFAKEKVALKGEETLSHAWSVDFASFLSSYFALLMIVMRCTQAGMEQQTPQSSNKPTNTMTDRCGWKI